MKKTTAFKIIVVIILVAVVLASILTIRIYFISKVTFGNKISSTMPTKSALLVLDIQNDTLDIREYGDASLLMKNINTTIEYAQANNIDVLYTKQVFSNPIDILISGGLYKKDSEGAELSDALEEVSTNIFEKQKTDSFSSNSLKKYLSENKITTLHIVGAMHLLVFIKQPWEGLTEDTK